MTSQLLRHADARVGMPVTFLSLFIYVHFFFLHSTHFQNVWRPVHFHFGYWRGFGASAHLALAGFTSACVGESAPLASATPTKAQREPCRLMEVKHLAFSMTDVTHARPCLFLCFFLVSLCTFLHAIAFRRVGE